MLAFLSGESIDYVIVQKVDRLARNRVDDVENNLALTEHEIIDRERLVRRQRKQPARSPLRRCDPARFAQERADLHQRRAPAGGGATRQCSSSRPSRAT